MELLQLVAGWSMTAPLDAQHSKLNAQHSMIGVRQFHSRTLAELCKDLTNINASVMKVPFASNAMRCGLSLSAPPQHPRLAHLDAKFILDNISLCVHHLAFSNQPNEACAGCDIARSVHSIPFLDNDGMGVARRQLGKIGQSQLVNDTRLLQRQEEMSHEALRTHHSILNTVRHRSSEMGSNQRLKWIPPAVGKPGHGCLASTG
mmetsp:Transcript_11036/g.30478  ORF Transcript_11036/g.30478 Transcript_11036/m.30478 type:complete len:204 (+) Transcript_11036:598-1209(+)